MSCGANVPFEDDGIFFGNTAKEIDQKIALIPDFVANCGMARVFAYLMQDDIEMTDESIFFDVSSTIGTFLKELHMTNKSLFRISEYSLIKSLQKLKA